MSEEQINENPTNAEQPKVVEQPKVAERYHCTNCRVTLTADTVTKLALDFKRNKDGEATTQPGRYSVFCKTCQQFIGIIDPEAAAIRTRIVNNK